MPVQVDTTSDESVRRMAEQAVAALGHIDILVNSAADASGFSAPPKLEDINDGNFWPEMDTKVIGLPALRPGTGAADEGARLGPHY